MKIAPALDWVPRRPGYLLQGLTCCPLCGYAFYGKPTRQRGRGRVLTDFHYYRCSGTDAYRFGGERICSNNQIRADRLENEIWETVSKILRNPDILELEDKDSTERSGVQENVNSLMAQRQKLQHGMDHLIDSLAEGVIEKDQFTDRVNRTKTRIADIDAKIAAQTSDEGRQAQLRSVKSRLTELSSHMQNQLSDADWTHGGTRRSERFSRGSRRSEGLISHPISASIGPMLAHANLG